MREKGSGSIVNVSSTAGLYGAGEYVAYCASKERRAS
jgi:NAD(P)-dependent dehydrogenase (short-subunit alcohol dehydrogenase family)